MDTTAAAELGMAVLGSGVDGVGFWDGGTSDQNRWPGDNPNRSRSVEVGTWERGEGRRSFGRRDRTPFPETEPPHKRVRHVPAESSVVGDSYGERFDRGFRGTSDNVAFSSLAGPDSEIGRPAPLATILPVQDETRKANFFSGEFALDTRPQTPSSSGAPGSPFTARGRSTCSIFFKTKLCTKFRAGTCPFNSNCNFAHGMEELRKPPPGWEDVVAVQDAERGSRNRESSGQPILLTTVSGNSDSQRFHKTRLCKKYNSEEGCPYGDRCNFLHDDQARARESNAISLGPTGSPSGSGGGGINAGERPPNWKTRMCNKWETTGHCPFGLKCHFAHGLAELQTYSGTHVDSDNGAIAGNGRGEAKQGGRASFKTFPDSRTSLLSTDGHILATTSRQVLASMPTHKQAIKSIPKWRGPADEISTIYGDWIEEDEWEEPLPSLKPATERFLGKISVVQQLKEKGFPVPSKGNASGMSAAYFDPRQSGKLHTPLTYGEPNSCGGGGVDEDDLWGREL